MGIETKTLGILIDELWTVNHKLWNEQDKITGDFYSPEEVAGAAKRAQALNKLRNALIRAIDHTQNSSEFSPTEKTY